MHVEITDADCDAIRSAVMGYVREPLPSNDLIRERLATRLDIVGTALEWDWDDTEVRDNLCVLFDST